MGALAIRKPLMLQARIGKILSVCFAVDGDGGGHRSQMDFQDEVQSFRLMGKNPHTAIRVLYYGIS